MAKGGAVPIGLTNAAVSYPWSRGFATV